MNIKSQKEAGLNDKQYAWYTIVYTMLYLAAKAGQYQWDDFASNMVKTNEFTELVKKYRRKKKGIIEDQVIYNAVNEAITDFLLTDIEKDIIAEEESDIARSELTSLYLVIRDLRKNNEIPECPWIRYHRLLFSMIVNELVKQNKLRAEYAKSTR